MDRLSNVPPNIIETILCLLPIQEAARTSILARDWRYHWIKIPKLVFDKYSFQVSADETELSVLEQTFGRQNRRKVMDERCKVFYAIYQILLLHEGPVYEFTLAMTADNSFVEIDHVLRHLSQKNTVKKLKLHLSMLYKLPRSVFSLNQLTDLSLGGCCLDYQPTFSGFDSLRSLCVYDLRTSTKTLIHLLSKCPLLKTVIMELDYGTLDCSKDSTVTKLFECLPVVETLSCWCGIIECCAQDGIPQKLPTALVHLKYLIIGDICFVHDVGLRILVLLIRSSPNLEKLKVEIGGPDYDFEECEANFFTPKDCSHIWLEHLKELEVVDFGNRDNELDFVKLILAKSPVLKKVTIFFDEDEEVDKVEILGILYRSQRASQVVKINVMQIETS